MTEVVVWPPKDEIDIGGTFLTLDERTPIPEVIRGKTVPPHIRTSGIIALHLQNVMDKKKVLKISEPNGQERVYRIHAAGVDMATGEREFFLKPWEAR